MALSGFSLMLTGGSASNAFKKRSKRSSPSNRRVCSVNAAGSCMEYIECEGHILWLIVCKGKKKIVTLQLYKRAMRQKAEKSLS